jgi:hypothetical protein
MKTRLLQIILLIIPFGAFSQNVKPERTGTDFQYYFNLQTIFGFTHNAMSKELGYNNYGWSDYITKQSSAPGLMLNFDYFFVERFSVGGYLGYNSATIEGNGGPLLSVQKGRVITWNTRFLVHFLHMKSIKSDLYTGIGLGVGIWSFKPDKTYDQIVYGGANAQFSFPIYLGYRYYFMDNLGATFELSTFKNNLINAGLTFRF